MPPKRSEKSRRNEKTLVSMFNLISRSLWFLTRVREARALSAPGTFGTHLAGFASAVKHTLSRKGDVGVGLPCLIKPWFHPYHIPRRPRFPASDVLTALVIYLLFTQAGRLVRTDEWMCSVWATLSPPRKTDALSPHRCFATCLMPYSTQASTPATAETGGLCWPSCLASRGGGCKVREGLVYISHLFLPGTFRAISFHFSETFQGTVWRVRAWPRHEESCNSPSGVWKLR